MCTPLLLLGLLLRLIWLALQSCQSKAWLLLLLLRLLLLLLLLLLRLLLNHVCCVGLLTTCCLGPWLQLLLLLCRKYTCHLMLTCRLQLLVRRLRCCTLSAKHCFIALLIACWTRRRI